MPSEAFAASLLHRPWEIKWEEGKPPAVSDVKNFLQSGGDHMILSTGTLPSDRVFRQQWRELNDEYPDRIIVREPESANRTPDSINAARKLGDGRVDPATMKIFNALPYEHEIGNFILEQNRMAIGGTPDVWRRINEDIKKASEGFKDVQTATRKQILDEFEFGTSSAMIIYAHYADGHLYLPGAHGGTISIDEIRQIVRKDGGAKNRVIILAACSTGRRAEDTRSLTSVLLEKGIAGTVMATDRPFDAKLIPDLIGRLKAGVPLRKAGAPGPPGTQGRPRGYLQQYVELHGPLCGPVDFGDISHGPMVSGQ